MPWIVLGSLEKGLALAGPSTEGWGVGGRGVCFLFFALPFFAFFDSCYCAQVRGLADGTTDCHDYILTQ